jgi:hypothetical protein
MGTLSFVDIDPSVTVLLPSLVPSVLFVKIVEPTKVPKAACATFVKAISLSMDQPSEGNGSSLALFRIVDIA